MSEVRAGLSRLNGLGSSDPTRNKRDIDPLSRKNMSMRPTLLIALAVFTSLVLLGADNGELGGKEKPDGWKALFNGKDLKGWRLYKSQAPPGSGWKAEDGIVKKMVGIRGGDIITEEQFGDFELSWEWRISPVGNNGVKYLVTESRTSAPGPEYQMIDDDRHPDGKFGPKRQTASLYDILPPTKDRPIKPVGEWNTSGVIIRGSHVEHWLNGAKVLEYELGGEALKQGIALSKFKKVSGFGDKIKGHIMLTDHGDECSFRNMKIREISH